MTKWEEQERNRDLSWADSIGRLNSPKPFETRIAQEQSLRDYQDDRAISGLFATGITCADGIGEMNDGRDAVHYGLGYEKGYFDAMREMENRDSEATGMEKFVNVPMTLNDLTDCEEDSETVMKRAFGIPDDVKLPKVKIAIPGMENLDSEA